MGKRAKNVLRLFGKGIAYLVASLAALLAIALLALQTPWAKAWIADLLTTQVSKAVHGQVEVTLNGHISPLGVSGVTARVLAEGAASETAPLAAVENVSAELNLWGLLQSLMSDGPLTLDIHSVELRSLMVDLRSDAEGNLALTKALTPHPSEPAPDSGGPAPVIRLQRFTLGHARILLPEADADARDAARVEAVLDELEASVLFDERLLAVVTLPAFSVPLPDGSARAEGAIDAWLHMDAAGIPSAKATLKARVGQLPVNVHGSYHDENWKAVLTTGGSASDWQSVGVGWAPTNRVEAKIHARGDLEAANIDVRVTSGPSLIGLDAKVGFAPLRANGRLTGSEVEPARLLAQAPEGRLNFDARFAAEAEPLSATLDLSVRRSSLTGHTVPDLDLQAELNQSQVEFQLNARDESKLSVTGEAQMSPETISFAVKGNAESLPEAPSLSQLQLVRVHRLDLDTSGTWSTEASTLNADVRLNVQRLRLPTLPLSATGISATMNVSGSPQQPKLDGLLSVKDLSLQQYRVSDLQLRAGTAQDDSMLHAAATVRLTSDGPPRKLATRARLVSISPLDARDIRLGMTGAGHAMDVTVARLHAGDALTVDQLHVTGVGEARGRVEVAGAKVDAQLVLEDLALPALSQLFTPLLPDMRGALTASLAIQLDGQRIRSGHLYSQGNDMGLASSTVDHLMTSLVLDNDKLSGSAELRRAGSLVRLDARQLDLVSLREMAASDKATLTPRSMSGYAVLTAHAHMADFPELEAALGELHAEGSIQASVAVHQTKNLPLTVSSIIRLTDFELRQLTTEEVARGRSADTDARYVLVDAREDQEASPQWSVQRVSADWASRYDGRSGNWANSLLVRNSDNPQPILGASFATQIPLARLASLDQASLSKLPVRGSLSIPRTSLDKLPLTSVVPTGIEAEVGGEVTVTGTVAAPHAVVSLNLDDLHVSSLEASYPISVALKADASPDLVDATVRLEHEGRVVARADVEGQPRASTWRVGASIDDMPLGCVPFLRDYGVDGSLSGEVALDSRSDAPVLTAKLTAQDIEAYGEKMPLVSLTAQLRDGTGQVRADLRQAEGRAQVDLLTRSPTGELGDYRPIQLDLTAEKFQVRPLMVALQGAVSDLSGLLAGRLRVNFEKATTEAEGEMRLTEGLVLIPAFGKEVRDIQVTARAKPGSLDITTIEANVQRGRLSGTGRIKYAAGGRFLAEAELELPEDRPLPISNQGRDVAEASGRIRLAAKSSGPDDEIDVTISIPQLDVYFSDSLGDSVMATEPPDFVSLGYFTNDGHFVSYSQREEKAVTTSSKPTVVRVTLGDEVWLHQGTSTFAAVRGDITAELGNEMRVTGALNLAEGRIDIQGRVFDVRPGSITFRGLTPPNPDIIAEAAWPSPSGYTIIAAYRGSIESGEIVLRSEPPLTYGEILNVLLFDDPQGDTDSEGSPGGASAVAASVASAGLSSSLTSLTNLDIQANIETTVDGSPRPELGVRLSPRLAVEVAYNVEPTTTLSEPPDNAFVSFDWRLSSSWSLQSTFGDKGSAAADVAWRYRY